MTNDEERRRYENNCSAVDNLADHLIVSERTIHLVTCRDGRCHQVAPLGRCYVMCR